MNFPSKSVVPGMNSVSLGERLEKTPFPAAASFKPRKANRKPSVPGSRKLRADAGLTLAEVTHAVGWKTPAQLSLYETNCSRPRRETLAKLAKFYRVPVHALIQDGSERAEVIRNYDRAGAEGQRLIGQVAALAAKRGTPGAGNPEFGEPAGNQLDLLS